MLPGKGRWFCSCAALPDRRPFPGAVERGRSPKRNGARDPENQAAQLNMRSAGRRKRRCAAESLRYAPESIPLSLTLRSMPPGKGVCSVRNPLAPLAMRSPRPFPGPWREGKARAERSPGSRKPSCEAQCLRQAEEAPLRGRVLALGPIDIQDSHWESVLIHCGSGQLIRSVVDGQAVRAQ